MDCLCKFILFQTCCILIIAPAEVLGSHGPRSDFTTVAPKKAASETLQNFRKAATGRSSDGAVKRGKNREKVHPHRVHTHGTSVPVAALATKKIRQKKSQGILSRTTRPGKSREFSAKKSSRRRRRSMQKVDELRTARRRRRSSGSISLTVHRLSDPVVPLPDSPSDPLVPSPDAPSYLKAGESPRSSNEISSNVTTRSKRELHKAMLQRQMQEIQQESRPAPDRPRNLMTMLLHLHAKVGDGSTPVLFLCALLAIGVLMIGGAVLCAGLSDHSHEEENDFRHGNQNHRVQILGQGTFRQEDRYSIESQSRLSNHWASPHDPPRPSSQFVPLQPNGPMSPPRPSYSPPTLSPPRSPKNSRVQIPTDPMSTPLQPQPKKNREKSAKREDNSKDSKDVKAADHLCPSLVVPSGMEFVFAVREDLDPTRQELNFNIVDLKGAPLSRVVVSERGDVNTAGCGIFLQTLTRMPLAMVDMKSVHESQSKSPLICRPNGEVFGQLKYDESGKYQLKNKAGKGLLIFHGDFSEKAVNVMNTVGKLVCATERCVVDFDTSPHYQVRIAPYVDAGLVICGLLCIDKLEPKNERSP